jgi:hypothetical protein
MARLAISGESCLLMVGIGGLVKIGLVAIDAVGGSAGVLTIGMTQAAVSRKMLSI